MTALSDLERAVLTDLTPTPEERTRIDGAVAGVTAAVTEALRAEELPGTPSVQGSIAKDTFLQGDMDIDLFLLMDPDVDEAALKQTTERVGRRVLDAPRKKYAQHPYIIGSWDGVQVDLVPAYRVAEAGARMSAVDRTPFHTAWVREHLTDTLRDHLRLLKGWCKGVGVYGAETSQAGFSGYLLEVLAVHFGAFHAVLDWLAAGATPRRIALGDDQVEDDVSPLVVVDPVDPTRNCAAAVGTDTLTLAAQAAEAYERSPSRRFWSPAPPRPEPAETLHAALAAEDAQWLGLRLSPQTDRLDVVLPQFQKAARTMQDQLERAGFAVRRSDVSAYEDDRRIGMQWVLDAGTLPATRVHEGPSSDHEPNASRFREKWQDHPDAAGPVREVDGTLQVAVAVPHRTPAALLAARLADAGFGKHMREAVAAGADILEDPARADAAWAPRVADVVLGRPPWER